MFGVNALSFLLGLICVFNLASASDEIPVYRLSTSPLVQPARVKLDYEIAPGREYASNYCEFAVKQFGVASAHNMSFSTQWLDVRLVVDRNSLEDEQSGRVLNVGAYVEFEQRETREGPDFPRAFFLASAEQERGRNFTLLVPPLEREGSRRAIRNFALFLDVKRANRTIERLWLADGSRNFTLREVFRNAPSITKSIGRGTIRYVGKPSVIYNQLMHCPGLQN